MIDLRRPSPFIELAASEAWDAWFRWRGEDGLRDLSIEDTWRRVSVSLASVEPYGEIAIWQRRFMDALASWRLLPDERLLADAGTGRVTYRGGVLHAALNAAAFVPADCVATPALDLAALADCAALAVRMLDNTALLAATAVSRLRIGILGIADALALLGLPYDSDAGRVQAAAMAQALAEGCLRGSARLALTRGVRSESGASPGSPRGTMPCRLRHTQLTAITAQSRLALLANDVADAADPLRERHHIRVIAAADGQRAMRSCGYAWNILDAHRNGGGEPAETLEHLPWTAQMAMRAALQPWIDEPIDYPLLTTRVPDTKQRIQAHRLAVAYGLGEPAWRNPAELQPS
jgi:ribonucleoside-diphosphate reductase alpha chain